MTFGQTWSDGNYTICDFTIMPDNSVLILDGMTGKIFRFGDGELLEIYDYDLNPDYLPHKIACDTFGNIYLVAAKHNCLITIDTNGEIHFSNFNDFDLASVSEFAADENNRVAVSLYDSEIGDTKTHILNITGETATSVNSVAGTIADTFICSPAHMKDLDDELEYREIGHRLRIELFNLNLDSVFDVTLSSDNWILGTVCYGKNGNEYIFKLVEVDDDNNYYNSLVFVDTHGGMISRYAIPAYGTLKSFNGVLYLFSQMQTEIQISEAVSLLEQIE